MDFEDIKAAILEERVIVFLGHSLSVNYKNPNCEREFFQDIFENNQKDIKAYHKEDNFLIFNSDFANKKIRRKTKPFYEQDFGSETLSKLAQIPFHSFLCLAPDMSLVNTFSEQKFSFSHLYWKNTTGIENEYSAQNPLIYHLFGCTVDTESIIISHSDLFNYIKFIHADGNQLQKAFGNTFDKDKYEYLLFLGCDFDKWYFQLVLNLLNVGVDYDSYESFAFNTEGERNHWKDVYEQYYQVKFVEEDKIDDFTNTLHSQFDENELRQAQTKPNIKTYHKQNIYKLLFEGFDDTNLRLMCQLDSDFGIVYDNFATGQDKQQRIEALISHAERHLLMEKLIHLAEQQNPAMYNQHKPYYDEY
jgi:hypothetical protein